MSLKIRLKHSSTVNKAPLPADLVEGELALNINAASPAAYIKDSTGAIVKIGGVSTAATPGVVQLADAAAVTAGTAGRVVDAAQLKAAQASQAGSSTAPAAPTAGQVWINNSVTPAVTNVWSGSGWIPQVGATVSSGTAPATPATGQVWVNNGVAPNVASIWDGTKWVTATPDGAAVAAIANDAKYATKAELATENTWDRTGTHLTPAVAGDVVNFSAGTALLPGLTPVGDLDTGIHSSAADHISIATGGVDRITVDDKGRVGMGGVTAPASGLEAKAQSTLSVTNGTFGAKFDGTQVKTYPTGTSANYTAYGDSRSHEVSSTVPVVTPTVAFTGDQLALRKSPDGQDVGGLSITGRGTSFVWADSAATLKSYTAAGNLCMYNGCDEHSHTTDQLTASSMIIAAPGGKTQTIKTVTCEAMSIIVTGSSPSGTTNITDWYGGLPRYIGFAGGKVDTRTANITNACFFDTSGAWGRIDPGTTNLAVTITNLYGLRLRPPAKTAGITITNNWGVYQDWSLAKNWFAGASNQFPNITTTASGANAFLDSADSNRLCLSTSSLVYKRDIENLDSSIADRVLSLRPVWYRSKSAADCQDWSWYGLIAEEVAEIDPRFVHYGYQESAYEFIEKTETYSLPQDDPRREDGSETEVVTRQVRQLKADAKQVPNGVAYERLVVPLLDIIKRQKSQLDSFEARLAALESK